MVNGKLEDPIVGIGSVGREMRKRFAEKWKVLYFVQPLSMGALTLMDILLLNHLINVLMMKL